jgi:hypothetical protein
LDFLQQVLASSIGTILAALGTLAAYRYYVKRIYAKYRTLFEAEEANLREILERDPGTGWDARSN